MRNTSALPRARTLRGRLTAVLAALGVVTMTSGVVVFTASAADAHAAVMSATAVCTPSGWDATFTVTNDPGNFGSATLSGTGTSLDGLYAQGQAKSVTVSKTTAAATATLPAATMTWSDFTQTNITATAQQPAGCPLVKVDLCHATDSDTAPFTYQTVDASSSTYQGHLDHRNNPQQVWKKGTWWNGVWHPAGSPKPDLIEGLDGVVNEALCNLPGTGPITVTPGVTFTDPTCAVRNGAWSGTNTDKVTYTVTSGGTNAGQAIVIGAVAKPGYEFAKSATTSFSHTFGAVPDCRTSVVPVNPTITQPVCSGQPGAVTPGSFTKPADANGITYTAAGNVVTATIDGTQHTWGTLPSGWTKDSETSAHYTVAYDANPDCRATVVPGTPTVTQAECTREPGGVTQPSVSIADTATIDYTVTGNVVTAALKDPAKYKWGTLPTGWSFVNGVPTYTATFNPVPDCTVAATPVTPTVHQAQCDGPGHATTPSIDPIDAANGISYVVDGNTVTATIDLATYHWGILTGTGWVVDGPLDSTATWTATFTDPGACLETVKLPTSLQPAPPSCTENGTFSLPEGPVGVTWTVTKGGVDVTNASPYGPGDYVVVAHPGTGYTLGNQSGEYDVTVLPKGDQSVKCLTIPTNNTPKAPECGQSGSYTVPGDSSLYTWTIKVGDGAPETVSDSRTYDTPGDYTAIVSLTGAAIEQGWHFSDGSTTHSYPVTVLGASSLECLVTAPTLTPLGATCSTNGSLHLPAVDHLVWVVDGHEGVTGPLDLGPGTHTVTAQTVGGYSFDGESTVHRYGEIVVGAATGNCPVFVQAVEPSVSLSGGCGLEGSYTIPDTAGVSYLLDGTPVAAGTHSGPVSGTLTAVATGNAVLTNPDFSVALSVPPAVSCPSDTEVTPAAPTFVDPTCADPEAGAVLFEDTDSVHYVQQGDVTDGGTVTVTAVPKTGFTFPEGAVASWSHTFPAGLVCASETSSPKPSVKPSEAVKTPSVKGTAAVVPTAVDAGLATLRSDRAASSSSLLAESLVGAGILLLASAGWLGLGRRRRGAHQH